MLDLQAVSGLVENFSRTIPVPQKAQVVCDYSYHGQWGLFMHLVMSALAFAFVCASYLIGFA
jgi:hypothetical protein